MVIKEAGKLDRARCSQARTDLDLYYQKVAREDDYKGFELLFKYFYKTLCSYALRYVTTTDAARDVVSEVFYRLWRNRKTLDLKVSCRAYLFTAVKHQAYNYLSREVKNDLSLEAQFEKCPVETASPEEILLYSELNRQFDTAIEALTPQCKHVFMLSRYEGLKYNEIANRLNITPKAVEAQITRALKILRPLAGVIILVLHSAL